MVAGGPFPDRQGLDTREAHYDARRAGRARSPVHRGHALTCQTNDARQPKALVPADAYVWRSDFMTLALCSFVGLSGQDIRDSGGGQTLGLLRPFGDASAKPR